MSLALSIAPAVGNAAPGAITTVAGGAGDGPAEALAVDPWGMALHDGALYVADLTYRVVRRIDLASGAMTVVAGNQDSGGPVSLSLEDGSAALDASLLTPVDLDVDGEGNLFVADGGHQRVLRIDAESGILTTVAGDGVSTGASFSFLRGIHIDDDGTLLLCDFHGNVLRLREGGTLEQVGGGGGEPDGDGGLATDARLRDLMDVTADAAGNIFLADDDFHRIRRIDATTGILTTVAGGGLEPAVEGALADTVNLERVWEVAVDANGDVVFGSHRGTIWKVDSSTGRLVRLAGVGQDVLTPEDPIGDGGPALSAHLAMPTALVFSSEGDLYSGSAEDHRIRIVRAATGTIDTIAGTGRLRYGGDGGPASAAQLDTPRGVAADAQGHLYVADTGNHRLRRIDAVTGVIETIAGTGEKGFAGDGGPALFARFDSPWGLVLDDEGHLYVADKGNARVRRIDAETGVVHTYAGGGTQFPSEALPATSIQLQQPLGLGLDASGNLLISDATRNRLFRVDATTGLVTTAAGTGAFGWAQENVPATASAIMGPYDGAADASGDIWFLESARAVRIDALTGTLHPSATIAGQSLGGIAFDRSGYAYVASLAHHRVLRGDLVRGGATVVAGTQDRYGFRGDGGPAAEAILHAPTDVAIDPDGNLYVADAGSHRVRRIERPPVCGDGRLDSGEACDDRGRAEGDGCDALCTLESRWECSGEPSVCVFTPAPGCRPDRRGSLLLRRTHDDRTQLTWDWKGIALTTPESFGDPTQDTTSELLLWDEDGANLRFRIELAPGESWRGSATGFSHRGSPFRKIRLRVDATGKARISVNGSGRDLPLPESVRFTPPVVVQWQRHDDPNECWESRFETLRISAPNLLRARFSR